MQPTMHANTMPKFSKVLAKVKSSILLPSITLPEVIIHLLYLFYGRSGRNPDHLEETYIDLGTACKLKTERPAFNLDRTGTCVKLLRHPAADNINIFKQI